MHPRLDGYDNWRSIRRRGLGNEKVLLILCLIGLLTLAYHLYEPGSSEGAPSKEGTIISVADGDIRIVVASDGHIRLENNLGHVFVDFNSANKHITFGQLADPNNQLKFAMQTEIFTSTSDALLQGIRRMYLTTNNPIYLSGFYEPSLATLRIDEPNVFLASGGTIGTADTLLINGAATEGFNNYALRIPSGIARLDGRLDLHTGQGILLLDARSQVAHPGTAYDGQLYLWEEIGSDGQRYGRILGQISGRTYQWNAIP